MMFFFVEAKLILVLSKQANVFLKYVKLYSRGDNVLDITMEFRKGILFIRLTGVLNKTTISKLNSEVTELIKDNGIKNVVFNVDGLTSIDLKGINSLLYNYELSKMNDGKAMLCGINNSLVRYRINNSRLLNYMNEVSDELSAINMIGM